MAKTPQRKTRSVKKTPKAAPLKKKAPAKKVAASKPAKASFAPELKVYPTPETLCQETAHWFMRTALDAVQARGRFVAALSGGTTPKGLFQQLSEEPYLSLVPWAHTYLFWVDERYVPMDDETSNYRMTKEFLLSKVPVPKEHVFPMSYGPSPVDQAASSYESKLRKFFGGEGLPQFDVALLGMGDDGHTASLFPGMAQVNEQEKWVVGYFVDKSKKERISLTFPVLNASRALLVLLEGAKKAERLKDVLEGPSDPPRLPIQYLRPTKGELIFAMDAAAASLLKKKK